MYPGIFEYCGICMDAYSRAGLECHDDSLIY